MFLIPLRPNIMSWNKNVLIWGKLLSYFQLVFSKIEIENYPFEIEKKLQKCATLLHIWCIYIFSGKPLSFGTVFTAFGVVVLGLNLSFALLLIEIITARYGCGRCKRIMNAYNYRITCNPNPPDMGWNVDRMRQLPISDNPWWKAKFLYRGKKQ